MGRGRGGAGPLPRRRSPPLLFAAASVALVCCVGRDTWFRVAAWDFLARSHEGGVASWLGAHDAHLQPPAVGMHRLLYAVFGIGFWPWCYLPQVLDAPGWPA
jgi:hypothetical protein